jgi:two-component sensor histidine kinase
LTIQSQHFKHTGEEIVSCGYSPRYDVWVRFTLTNSTSNSIEKIIEYDNPLTSSVEFFEEKRLVKKNGLLHRAKERQGLHPILKITVEPHHSKEFYIKVSSKITTLIIKLNLWSIETFNQKEMKNTIILALFFGAMGIVVLYNIIVLFVTKELNYLYFILFFITVGFHHLMYKGVMTLYFSSETMEMIINCSSCVVALPILFLALFTQRVLKLEQYPTLNKILKYIFLLYTVVILTIWATGLYEYRSLFVVAILIYLFIVTSYAFFKKNKQSPLLFFSWIVFITSGIFMYLSSRGIYHIFAQYPYYLELVWTLAIAIFSLTVFTSKIKALQKEKVNLAEFKHRFTNNMQTILNFLLLQKDAIEHENTKAILTDLEYRIMATTELSSLLDIKEEGKKVSIHEYFSLITKNLQESFKQHHINIKIKSDIIICSDLAVYCGQIVNEAVTNAFKYAFNPLDSGEIEIILTKNLGEYHLIIRDNGQGFKEKSKDGLGLDIIKTLAKRQLEGTLDIKKDNGVEITIKWSEDER